MASLQKQLHEMNGDELLTLWRERRGLASETELAEILHHLEDAEIEDGSMAVDGMPFPGELTGGGKDQQLQKFNRDKAYLESCIANGGSKINVQRDLTTVEKESGETESGVVDRRSGRRQLTDAEMLKGKILVQAVYTEKEMQDAKQKLAELLSAKEAYTEDISILMCEAADPRKSYMIYDI